MALTCRSRAHLLHFVALLTVYLAIWLASYGFDIARATSTQLTGGTSNFERFVANVPLAVFSLAAAFKLTLVAALVAIAKFGRAGQVRPAIIVCCAIGGGFALMAIATDYTRMAAFGGFAMLFALPAVLSPLPVATRRWLACANLAIPTVYVGAMHGAVAYQGLYGLILTAAGFGLQR